MSLHKNRELGKSSYQTVAGQDRTMGSFARLTGSGRSAIAILALDGADSESIIQRCFQPAIPRPFLPGQIRYGMWVGADPVNTLDTNHPSSAATGTGESVVVTPGSGHYFEIHCHGGPAAVARIENDLRACGATSAAGTDDWNPSDTPSLIREAEAVLAECTTARTAAIAMNQVRGSLLDWATRWQASLTPAGLSKFNSEVKSLLNAAFWTTRLADPFRVVLAGPPNVGKSSLLNALVGFDRSITLDVAGTTRDVLHANTVIAGLPVRLSDTAGIRESEEVIEREGIRKAQQAVREADLLLLVSEPLPGGDFSDPPSVPKTIPQLRILNKVDQILNKVDQKTNQPSALSSQLDCFDASTNALTGEGLTELMDTIADKLGRPLPKSGKPALINQRQWKIMEQCSEADSLEKKSQLLNHLMGHNNG